MFGSSAQGVLTVQQARAGRPEGSGASRGGPDLPPCAGYFTPYITSAAQGCSLLRPGLQPPASMLRPLRPRVAASGAQGCSQEDLQPPQFHTRYLSSVAAPYLARYLRYLRIFMYNESVSSPYLRLYLHRILLGLNKVTTSHNKNKIQNPAAHLQSRHRTTR